MNSLFSEFFGEFSGVILGVCETIWGLFGSHFEGNWKEFEGKTIQKTKKNSPKPYFLLFKIALNSLFNE